MSANFLKNAL